METWTGIISGTNRGLVILKYNLEQENIIGNFELYDVENINLAGKIEGKIEGDQFTAKVFDFTPTGEGVPTEGEINLTISEDKAEMRGTWETNIGSKGECILYKFSIKGQSQKQDELRLSCESKEVLINFCSFNKRNIYEIFNIMTDIANSLIKDSKSFVLPPIYSIKYDNGESLRTYDREDFFSKFNDASKIWYVGFEFRDKNKLTNIFVNLHSQDIPDVSTKSNVLVESTEKNIFTMIPEIVRGLVYKAKNKNRFWHHWGFQALVQIFAVTTMFALSFFTSKKLSAAFPEQLGENRVYIFVIMLIILSNLWGYLFRLVFNGLYKIFPVVEIANKPKSKLWPAFIIGVLVSLFASVTIYCIKLLSSLFL